MLLITYSFDHYGDLPIFEHSKNLGHVNQLHIHKKTDLKRQLWSIFWFVALYEKNKSYDEVNKH